jgi:hypothetical protein
MSHSRNSLVSRPRAARIPGRLSATARAIGTCPFASRCGLPAAGGPDVLCRLLRSGLHAAGVATAEVARVTDPVVVVSGGARPCPIGVR